MLACPQCKRALNTSTEKNGLRAHCKSCAITILSVGRLMQISNPTLVSTLWQSIVEVPHADLFHIKCPRCAKGLNRISVKVSDLHFPIIACKKCYTVVIKDSALHDLTEKTSDHQALQLRKISREFEGTEEAISSLIRDLYIAFVQFFYRAPLAVRILAGVLASLCMVRFFSAVGTVGMIAGFLIAIQVLPDSSKIKVTPHRTEGRDLEAKA